MAISNIATSIDATITIGAAGSDRIVVAKLLQNRSPVAIQNIQFNGVAGNLAVSDTTGGYGTAIYYWLEADLPASAGTYTLTHSFLVEEILIYAEGVAQAAPTDTAVLTDFVTGSGTAEDTERKTTLVANVGDLCVASCFNGGTSNGAITGNTLVTYNSTRLGTYTTSQVDVGILSNQPMASASAASFAPAAPTYTITSIDGDNDVQAGQPNVDIIMTATTGVTVSTLGGEALTINGVT